MPSIVVGVESNQVTVQHPKQDLVAHRQDSVDLTAGKWSVQKEANLDILLVLLAHLLAKHLRHEHKVVVVDPDKVAIVDIIGDSLCEQPVCLSVCLPGRLVKGNLSRVIVE